MSSNPSRFFSLIEKNNCFVMNPGQDLNAETRLSDILYLWENKVPTDNMAYLIHTM